VFEVSASELDQLWGEMEQLARLWEQYLSGDPTVKLPPQKEQAQLAQKLAVLSRQTSLTTAQRFRVEGLLHRYTLYCQLWERRLRAKLEGQRLADAARAASVKVEEDEVSRLHREYVASLQRLGKRVQVDLEAFRRVLAEQRRRLQEQGLEVQGFTVVQEGDKVSLRARARKKEGK
jgi:hypothetical protein